MKHLISFLLILATSISFAQSNTQHEDEAKEVKVSEKRKVSFAESINTAYDGTLDRQSLLRTLDNALFFEASLTGDIFIFLPSRFAISAGIGLQSTGTSFGAGIGHDLRYTLLSDNVPNPYDTSFMNYRVVYLKQNFAGGNGFAKIQYGHVSLDDGNFSKERRTDIGFRAGGKVDNNFSVAGVVDFDLNGSLSFVGLGLTLDFTSYNPFKSNKKKKKRKN